MARKRVQTEAEKRFVAALNKASYQKLFDKTYNFLMRQKVSSREGDTCLYKGPKNTRCAVGLHAPADVKLPEGHDIWSLVVVNVLTGLTSKKRIFLSRLQGIHDSYMPRPENTEYGLARWQEEMENMAQEYGLIFKK